MSINTTARIFLALSMIVLGGCGHQGKTIKSARDISLTPVSEYMISVVDLPLADYPKLQKFRELEHIQVSGYSTPTTDEHIEAIAQLEFPQVRQVYLSLCHNVTDKGIHSLTALPSIKGLLLRGTAITDRGMLILATGFPNLEGINVEDCNLLTKAGFLELNKSSTITSVGMSLNPFSARQVEEIIDMVPTVTMWSISDPRNELDHQALRQLKESKSITIHIVDSDNEVTSLE